MLAIRMQRTGRSGHAQFRVIVQDSRFSPTSGRVVAQLGSYDPHSKAVTLDKEKASAYLSNGAQPSESVAKLLKREGVKLPDWVKETATKQRPIKNQDKLRRNRPEQEVAPEAVATEEPAVDAEQTPSEPAAEPAAEAPAETETPAEEESPQEPEAEPAASEEPAAETTEESAALAEEK